MSRTYKDRHDPQMWMWGKAGRGKWFKRQVHKARRQLAKSIIAYQLGEIDYIRDSSYMHASGECNWRGM